MSREGAQWLGHQSLTLLLKFCPHTIIFLHFPETHNMQLSLQLASELKGNELQCLIEGNRTHFKELALEVFKTMHSFYFIRNHFISILHVDG